MPEKFRQKPIGHTAYWIDLGSDYEYIRHAWILEAIREIKTARKMSIDLINFHDISMVCFMYKKER